jgi:hypothetical protein
LRLTSGL